MFRERTWDQTGKISAGSKTHKQGDSSQQSRVLVGKDRERGMYCRNIDKGKVEKLTLQSRSTCSAKKICWVRRASDSLEASAKPLKVRWRRKLSKEIG